MIALFLKGRGQGATERIRLSPTADDRGNGLLHECSQGPLLHYLCRFRLAFNIEIYCLSRDTAVPNIEAKTLPYDMSSCKISLIGGSKNKKDAEEAPSLRNFLLLASMADFLSHEFLHLQGGMRQVIQSPLPCLCFPHRRLPLPQLAAF